MARLTWGEAGQRFYETGVDRGVLYVGDSPGVAWNGLTSVQEAPSGGEPRTAYLDGVKYLNVSKMEEYAATITAFYSPPEFDVCDGIVALSTGLIATQQGRKSFGLSYRSMLGNDTEGAASAYKIHLVYNALAMPTQRTYNTLSEQAEANTLSWSITAKPEGWAGVRPTSQIIVDSTKITPELLAVFEDIIYGTDEQMPRLPTPTEVETLFTDFYEDLIVTPYDTGVYDVTSNFGRVQMLSEDVWQVSGPRAVYLSSDTYTITSTDDKDPNEFPIRGEALWNYSNWGVDQPETAKVLWSGASPRLSSLDDTTFAHISESTSGAVAVLKLGPMVIPDGSKVRVTARVRLLGSWGTETVDYAEMMLVHPSSTAFASNQVRTPVPADGAWHTITSDIPWLDEIIEWVNELSAGEMCAAFFAGATGPTESYDVSYLKAEVIS